MCGVAVDASQLVLCLAQVQKPRKLALKLLFGDELVRMLRSSVVTSRLYT